MGATCIKDSKTTPKVAGEGGHGAAANYRRNYAANGAQANNAAGRPPQPAANEKVPEKGLGAHCGVLGNNNNDNNGKPAGGGGIAAYRPSDDVAKAYFEHINELRSVAIATGVLPAVEGVCEADSTKNNDGLSLADSRRASDYPVTACPPLTTLTVYQCQPLQGDTVVAKGMYSSVHLARLSVFASTPETAAATATAPRHPAGRRASDGSSIIFSPDPGSADGSDSRSLSFTSGPPNNNSVNTGSGGNMLRSPPTNNSGAGSGNGGPAGGPAAHYIIAMKEVPMYASYSASVVLEQIRMEVRNWTRLSAYSSRVLRCYVLEYAYPDNVSTAVPEACCHFFPGLSNEELRTPKPTTASPYTSPIGKMLERKKSTSGSTSPKLFGSFGKGRGSPLLDPALAEASGTPQKLRLYLEYAKYGTLRGFQSKDMPEKFNKRRLHELTARAYMRDVLLALLQVHECGELQYDLCAKSIFMNRPIQAVYNTYFPAYISDVPAGDLTSVTPTQLGKALGLLDPPMPQPASSNNNNNTNNNSNNLNNNNNNVSGSGNGTNGMPSKRANGDPYTTGNEPINGAVQGGNTGVTGSPSGQMGDISVITHDASMVPQISMSDGRNNINANLNNRNNNNNSNSASNNNVNAKGPLAMTAYEQRGAVADSSCEAFKPSPDDGPLPSNAGTPPRREGSLGSPKKRNSGLRTCGRQTSANSLRTANYVEGDDAADHQRLNEVYCRYMDDYDFTRADGDDVPFPSPHDGIEAQADAELIAATLLPEEPRPTPVMRVLPLQRSSLGGVVLLSPNHYLVKPSDPLHQTDLRGRLPMVLTRATDTTALVCGNPHTTAPTFSPTPASNSSPAAPGPAAISPTQNANAAVVPLQHTMSSGTTMVDAAGALGRARGGVPLTKLNHAALIRRALAYGDADKIEDVPVHKYVTVTHAAPEVLHRRTFSTASDIYAFAMTFLELVTDDGNIMDDCLPQNLPKPKTRREKEEYDVQLTANLDKWYQTRLNALRQNMEAVAKEQELPAVLTPRAGPTVVRIPEHLSDEGRNMLRWCLQHDPHKRPTAAELLRSRYFMLGDWIAAPTVVAAERGVTKPVEKPWDSSVSYDSAAKAIGLPLLQDQA